MLTAGNCDFGEFQRSKKSAKKASLEINRMAYNLMNPFDLDHSEPDIKTKGDFYFSRHFTLAGSLILLKSG